MAGSILFLVVGVAVLVWGCQWEFKRRAGREATTATPPEATSLHPCHPAHPSHPSNPCPPEESAAARQLVGEAEEWLKQQL